ncbi:hypothetical protein QFC19_003469 [Naganishia cerealis]|uniref:Uncharacterized protein n=1 Tax=Naganishia cerealis TaxID=610337 RepID=A0ACC2W315_9TREE|nr:hypothetical protein QFC19_003469 [Naganishia cerealis]
MSLQPSILKDLTTMGSGVVAAELAAQEEGLISKQNLRSHSYGALLDGEEAANDEEDASLPDNYALPRFKLYTVILSLFMAAFLAALDTTVVTTLLTVIASDLNAIANISWIATAYLLSCAAFQPLFGKLSDIFGRKILLLLCCFFFAVGCLICVTDSLAMLVLGRFITGWGGSGLTTLGTITLSDLIPLRDRGLYQGMANIFFGLGAAFGGIFGGIVADWLGWRYVFLLQTPLAGAVGLALWWNLQLPEGSPGLGAKGDIRDKLKRVDFQGSFFLVSALMCIMAAASFGGDVLAYSLPYFIGLCVVSLVFLAAFVYTELYVSDEPILPIELLTERTILSSSLTNWFVTMGVFANLFYVPVFFTSVMGYSATQSGMRMIPNFIGVSVGSVGAGLVMKHTGRYYRLNVGAGFLTVLGAILIVTVPADASILRQYSLFAPSGLGYSCILTVTLLALIAAVPMKYQACTTSIQYTFRSTGSTLGVSIASAIFQLILRSNLNSKVSLVVSDAKTAHKIIKKALENTNYVNKAPLVAQKAILESYYAACKGAFGFSVTVITIGVFCSWFMKEHKLHSSLDRE